jgi:hypothetical protein
MHIKVTRFKGSPAHFRRGGGWILKSRRERWSGIICQLSWLNCKIIVSLFYHSAVIWKNSFLAGFKHYLQLAPESCLYRLRLIGDSFFKSVSKYTLQFPTTILLINYKISRAWELRLAVLQWLMKCGLTWIRDRFFREQDLVDGEISIFFRLISVNLFLAS